MTTQTPLTEKQCPAPLPSPIILQPQSLEDAEGESFSAALASAIAGQEAIVVDLLWITQLEHRQLATLANAFLTAQAKGNPLTFLSMDQATRAAFDRVIHQATSPAEHAGSYGVFAPEFEAFLDRHHQAKSSAALP